MTSRTCPGCGRPMRATQGTCMYCGATATTSAITAVPRVHPVAPSAPVAQDHPRICPGCQRPARGRVVRCFYCGHDLPARLAPPQRSCPRCRIALQVVTATWVSVDACAACGGIFFDRGELEREQRIDAQQFRWLQAQLRPCTPDGTTPLHCPGCGESMRALTPGGDETVIIDACPGCSGWWLDAGEAQSLHQIALRGQTRRSGSTWDRAEAQVNPRVRDLVEQQTAERMRERARRGSRNLDPRERERQKKLYGHVVTGRDDFLDQSTVGKVITTVDVVGDVIGWLMDP